MSPGRVEGLGRKGQKRNQRGSSHEMNSEQITVKAKNENRNEQHDSHKVEKRVAERGGRRTAVKGVGGADWCPVHNKAEVKPK